VSQRQSDLTQHAVTAGVTLLVVDSLQMVDVEKRDERFRRSVRDRPPDSADHGFATRRTVRSSRYASEPAAARRSRCLTRSKAAAQVRREARSRGLGVSRSSPSARPEPRLPRHSQRDPVSPSSAIDLRALPNPRRQSRWLPRRGYLSILVNPTATRHPSVCSPPRPLYRAAAFDSYWTGREIREFWCGTAFEVSKARDPGGGGSWSIRRRGGARWVRLR
jgi:hypothetical protein